MPIFMLPGDALNVLSPGEKCHIALKDGGGFQRAKVEWVGNKGDGPHDCWPAFVVDGREVLNDFISEVQF